MRKIIFFLIISIMAISIPGSAKKFEGVIVPDTLKAGRDNLVFNGAGVREKFFMDIYVGSLYLKKKSSHSKNIINADEAMAIRLSIVSRLITADKFIEATNEGFEKSTGGNTAPIKNEIKQFINTFKNGIHKGDVYDLVYYPGVGVKVFKNGKLKSTTKGLKLKKALFGIWLGKNPIQKDLKKGMLGK